MGGVEVILHDLVTYSPDDNGRIISHFDVFISCESVMLCIERHVFSFRDLNPSSVETVSKPLSAVSHY